MRYREEEDMKKPVAGIRPGIAAGVTAVTAVCCLRSDWERKHFVTTEYTLRTKRPLYSSPIFTTTVSDRDKKSFWRPSIRQSLTEYS